MLFRIPPDIIRACILPYLFMADIRVISDVFRCINRNYTCVWIKRFIRIKMHELIDMDKCPFDEVTYFRRAYSLYSEPYNIHHADPDIITGFKILGKLPTKITLEINGIVYASEIEYPNNVAFAGIYLYKKIIPYMGIYLNLTYLEQPKRLPVIKAMGFNLSPYPPLKIKYDVQFLKGGNKTLYYNEGMCWYRSKID